MRKNRSPWLHQLQKDRVSKGLVKDIQTDVAIVGAGIAGMATAFFILKYTPHTVAVLERFKLAHGATGHNAGQVTSYFERGFASLAEEFGLGPAARGQRAVEDAWQLLDEIYSDAQMDIPLARFVGHAGLTSYAQTLLHLRNNEARKRAGLNTEEICIAKEALFAREIPPQYRPYYTLVPHRDILELLETRAPEYTTALSYQKGCINSALLCERLLYYLNQKYPERFVLYEYTQVEKILLKQGGVLIDAQSHTVEAARAVLCTNGFESVRIITQDGLDVDARFHASLRGGVGYMSGYLENLNKPPTAISYFPEPAGSAEVNYFYLTRRPYEYEEGTHHNLISIGGPEVELQGGPYSFEQEYPEEMGERIDDFVRRTYDTDPNKKIDYIFTWHGLIGYTKNGVRMVGPEPKNARLLYNLGCNGVGILPSIFGGRTVARHVAGERVEKSIFDVPSEKSKYPRAL